MKNSTPQSSSKVSIVRYSESVNTNIHAHQQSRCAIGYILRGTRYIYEGDMQTEIRQGSLFFMGIGSHYTEERLDSSGQFEQVVIYYSPEQIARAVTNLSLNYQMSVENNHRCGACHNKNVVASPSSSIIHGYFAGLNSTLRNESELIDEMFIGLKFSELLYLVLNSKHDCMRHKILSSVDIVSGHFEHIVNANIFSDISIGELALLCNRSLTSFKKEFRRHYDLPPHQWYILQRLQHARLLLLSTTKSIAQVGAECAFPNTSHFIKLFKKEFHTTPAAYRTHDFEMVKNAESVA